MKMALKEENQTVNLEVSLLRIMKCMANNCQFSYYNLSLK